MAFLTLTPGLTRRCVSDGTVHSELVDSMGEIAAGAVGAVAAILLPVEADPSLVVGPRAERLAPTAPKTKVSRASWALPLCLSSHEI